ncbi:MAG: S1 RNA-binding domain-containing protein [Bacteroidota bacterium]
MVESKFPVGSRHLGHVRNMTTYGLFVELEEGVDGLVHISDLSWTKKFSHPSEYVKTGEQLEVIVLDIDPANRRLSLGHKQLTEDVWETFASIFTIGSAHKGTIKRVDPKGAVAELAYGVEGTIPSKHLRVEEGKEAIKVDDVVDLVVIEFNKDAKRLVLSHTKSWRQDSEPAVAEKKPRSKGRSKSSGSSAQAGTTTLGDLDALVKLKEQMEAQEKGGSKSSAKAKTKAKAKAEPVVEEPVAEEPAAEEPKVEEPKAEEPKAEAPAVEETAAPETEAEEKSEE